MATRFWRTLTGSAAALTALMLFAAPASAQFEEEEGFGYEEGYGEEEGYGGYLDGYYGELGGEAEYADDYTGYYEEEEDDWF